MHKNHLFCFGIGYVANHLIAYMKQQNADFRYSGTKRALIIPQTNDILVSQYGADCDLPQDITHILISIPPESNGIDIVLRDWLPQILQLPHLQWIGYLSATSVYGDRHGEITDETCPIADNLSHFAWPRAQAEQKWQNIPKCIIFRLSGIYGPGRSELEKALAKQSRIIKKPEHVFSRIHVLDIASALYNSMLKPTVCQNLSGTGHNIFNLADDYPCSHEEVVLYAAQLLNLEAPLPEDFNKAEMSDMLRYFYSRSVRVSNQKAKEILSWQLQYPTYREGLSAIKNDLQYILPKP